MAHAAYRRDDPAAHPLSDGGVKRACGERPMATRNKPEPNAAEEIEPLDVLHHVLKLNARLMQPF